MSDSDILQVARDFVRDVVVNVFRQVPNDAEIERAARKVADAMPAPRPAPNPTPESQR